MLTLLFDGVAYGMLLFVLAVGLSITLGLMNFINLAHGAFAMLGGYAMVILFKQVDVPFLLCLPIVFVLVALVGALMERLLYRHLYQRSHLDQVLFSIGLAFMSVAAVDYLMGSSQQNLVLPHWLQGRGEWGEGAWSFGFGYYRLFIMVVCAISPPAKERRMPRGDDARVTENQIQRHSKQGGDSDFVEQHGMRRKDKGRGQGRQNTQPFPPLGLVTRQDL